MPSVRDCLADIWHNGIEENGLWITGVFGAISVVNLATGNVTVTGLSGEREDLSFGDWVQEHCIPIAESITEVPKFFL